MSAMRCSRLVTRNSMTPSWHPYSFNCRSRLGFRFQYEHPIVIDAGGRGAVPSAFRVGGDRAEFFLPTGNRIEMEGVVPGAGPEVAHDDRLDIRHVDDARFTGDAGGLRSLQIHGLRRDRTPRLIAEEADHECGRPGGVVESARGPASDLMLPGFPRAIRDDALHLAVGEPDFEARQQAAGDAGRLAVLAPEGEAVATRLEESRAVVELRTGPALPPEGGGDAVKLRFAVGGAGETQACANDLFAGGKFESAAEIAADRRRVRWRIFPR